MTPLLVRLAVLLAVFVAIFIAVQYGLGAYLNYRAENKSVNRRLALIRAGLPSEAVTSILRKGITAPLSADAGVFERWAHGFQRNVRMADLNLEARSFALLCCGLFLGILLLAVFLAWVAKAEFTIGVVELLLLFSAVVGFGLPYLFVSRRAEKRRKRMEEQFPLAIDVFTRALRAGHPVSAAIDLLTREMEDPLGSEFGMVADEVAYGSSLTDSLMALADRWDLEDIRMFVVSLSLQSETGGNLAEILGNLSSVIRDRASLYMKVRALSSEGRMSGWMLTALPLFTFVTVFLVNPAFYLDVAKDPIFVVGLPVMLAVYALGVFIIRRMIDLKV